jgi:glycosyltransferase involved in cell wall biosynthesis
MRVLIFSTAYFPFVGGAEVAVWEVTSRLGSGIAFDLITARLERGLPSVEKIGNVTVYRIGPGIPLLDKLLLPFLGAWKALSLHRKHEYDYFWGIMVSYSAGAAYLANILRRLGGKKRVPMILTLQEGDSELYLKWKWGGLIRLSWRLALARTDKLTAISTYLLRAASRLGYAGESFLIPNGVSVKKFEYHNQDVRELIRKNLGFGKDDVLLITTSRLTHKNAVDDLISALVHLPEEFKLLVLGTGELEKSLVRQADKLKVAQRTRFLRLQPQQGVIDHLHASDIFVRASRSEGMGNSFVEAMAAGVPVIGTKVGGIPDFLKDRETGLFSNVNDPQSIAYKVREYQADPELKARVIENAKRLVREKYDWDLIAREMKSKVFST